MYISYVTIPEEIEQLKIKLDRTTDEHEQAEVLLDMHRKYYSIRSIDSHAYIDPLLLLAEKLHEPLYKAWGLYYLSGIKHFKGEYDLALEICNQALSIFGRLKEVEGIAACYNNIGLVYQYQGNYPEAIKNHFASLKLNEEIGDKNGIASSYNHIGNIYLNQGNYPDTLKNHFAALKLREEIGDKNGVAGSYNNIGNIYYHQGNYPDALKNYFASLKLQEEIGDKNSIASSYTSIGVVYLQQGNYPEALKNHFSGLKLFEEIGRKHGIASSYTNIGIDYDKQGNYPDALKYHFSALKLWEEIGDKLRIANSYNNIGGVYGKQGNYPDALKNFSASLKIREEIGDKNGIAASCINIGCIYEKQGNYPDALKNFFASLKLNEEIGSKNGIATSYFNIGMVYEKQGNYPDALKYLSESLQLSEEIGDKEIVKDNARALSNTYTALSEYKNALIYYEKYHEVEKEMLGAESRKQLNNLSFMHNLEQKEKDLEIEQLRNVELKKERDRSESLLLNILPAEVAEELKDKGTADAKLFDEVTVLFTDFKGFTTVSERLSPQQLVDELHACFSAFDNIMHKHGIEKIKTVGDAYLAVCGLPIADETHAENIVKAAIDIREFMLGRRKELGEMTFEIRIGVHTGSVVAGIVGVKKFAYDIWGDTVNTAARMEQNSEAGKINISGATYDLVKDRFSCTYRGEIDAKNKGRLRMYFVNT